jgi:thiol-disulfide isomerase/thioredoxin
VVDFWASWCRPCDDAAAHLAYLAKRYASGPYAGRVKFYHVQLEETVNPQLNKRFGFDAIPVVYFYYTGSGRVPTREAPLLEASIQGGDASIEDCEWRIQSMLRRHGLLAGSGTDKAALPLQRYPSGFRNAGQPSGSHRALANGASNDRSVNGAGRNDGHVVAGRRPMPALRKDHGAPGRLLRRQPAGSAGGAARYGTAGCGRRGDCGAGVIDPCQIDRCSPADLKLIPGDFMEAQDFVNQAVLALKDPAALSDQTREILDWFFRSHDPATVQIVRERLGLIQHCLSYTLEYLSYGCDPDEGGDAYTTQDRSPIGTLQPTKICLTANHFTRDDPRVRATTIIHECGHRIGLSPAPYEDIYYWMPEFRFLDREGALYSTETYAEFAAAIAKGVKTTSAPTLGLSFGRASFPGGSNTWVGRLYYVTELQHPRNRLPVVSWVNPFWGVGITLLGEATTAGSSPLSADKSLLATLILGARFGDPRPAEPRGFSVSAFVAPGISTQFAGGGTIHGKAFGAEAGVALDYSWKWLHAAVGVGAGYDGLREAGADKFYTLTGSVAIDAAQLAEWLRGR